MHPQKIKGGDTLFMGMHNAASHRQSEKQSRSPDRSDAATEKVSDN